MTVLHMVTLVMVQFTQALSMSAAPVTFSDNIGSYMVLQQAPAVACVYGMLGDGGTSVKIKVNGVRSDYTNKFVPLDLQANVTGGGTWKACLPPQSKGGDYTVTATCIGCLNTTVASIEHVTFGDVWYCSGQSNMALPLLHTYSRNATVAAIQAGKYSNIRIHGMEGNMNPTQPWSTLQQALEQRVGPGNSSDSSALMRFSATCFYFAQELTDKFGSKEAPPIGLVHTAWGGSTIEQWLSNDTIATCQAARITSKNQEYHDSRVLPYLNMSLKGFLWYQVPYSNKHCRGSSRLTRQACTHI